MRVKALLPVLVFRLCCSVRRWIPYRWGTLGLGGAASDSAWIGIDGTPVASVTEGGEHDAWGWASLSAVELTPGEHVVRLRVREGGFAVDRLPLRTNAGLVPSGRGPGETLADASAGRVSR